MDERCALPSGESRAKGREAGSSPLRCEAGAGALREVAAGSAAKGAASDELISVSPVDLFGDPVLPPRGAGRPRHVPTQETRVQVSEMSEQGLDQHEIAAAIGVTAPTLRLNYAVELCSTSITGARRAVRDQAKGN